MTIEAAGRRHQKVTYFTDQTRWGLGAGLGVLAAAVLWWVASAATGRVAVSYDGFITAIAQAAHGQAEGLTAVVWALLVAGAVVLVITARRRIKARGKTAVGMSDRDEVRQIAGEQAARDAARYTRRASIKAGLNIDTCPVAEVGWRIGTAHGEPVVLDLQTQVGVFGPTGMGKTRYLMANAAHDAPGALVITTTKLRDYQPLIAVREKVGRVFVWDPLDRSGHPHPMYWDPIADAADSTIASARGTAFAGGMTETQSDAGKFFGDACALIMTRLLMAAALDNRVMEDVVAWGVHLQSAGVEAVEILRRQAAPVWAETLNSMISGDSKTTANMKMTLALKLEPLLSPVVLRQMTPNAGAMEFDPAVFVRSTDTLIIVTDDNERTNVAPLSTMLLNEVTDAAKGWAARGGLLDPPLTIVGDEIANVAPLPKLPAMLSDSRGTGIRWVIAAQSLAQLRARWGQDHAEQILANLNASIVLGGLQDAAAIKRFSELAGKADVVEASAALNADHQISSTQFSTRERDVFRAEEIAHLPMGVAFMLLRNGRSLLVDLVAYDER